VITLGVDLSAEPRKTVVARLEWGAHSVTMLPFHHRAYDETIVRLSAESARVGIDCPFGWPQDFVDFVQRHQRGSVAPGEGQNIAAREHLGLRRTDIHVRTELRLTPLSVSTDRIGRAAMRGAGLLAMLSTAEPLDRSGAGKVLEVYPAAALRVWGFDARTYKGKSNLGRLANLARRFFEATADWLIAGDQVRAECASSDDAFDAVIAALNARAAELPNGVSVPDSPQDRAAAATEGWIAFPMGSLADLDPR